MINGRRWVADLYAVGRHTENGSLLVNARVAMLPGDGGRGYKMALQPAQTNYEAALRHGREWLLLMGFEPI